MKQATRQRGMTTRAVPHVRQFLGQRLRALRKHRGLSQSDLAQKASLSGKFISEVERGEKSISVDSLYRVSVALGVPLSLLADVKQGHQASVPMPGAEQVTALVATTRLRPAQLRKAHELLRTVLS